MAINDLCILGDQTTGRAINRIGCVVRRASHVADELDPILRKLPLCSVHVDIPWE